MALERNHYLVMLAIFIADRLTKWLVDSFVSQTITLLPFLKIMLVKNAGVAFGLLHSFNLRWPLIVVSLAVIIFLLQYSRKQSEKLVLYAIALIIAGAAGNLFDRLIFGEVIDFISVGFWPAFNVADAALTIGVAGFLYGVKNKS